MLLASSLKRKERFRFYRGRFFGLDLEFYDPLSLYYELRYIFKDEIYRFDAVRSDPVIVDGGGFIGLAALYFKTLYPNAKILTFEPNPHALTLLHRNLLANGVSDVEVISEALYDRNGEEWFRADETDSARLNPSGQTKVRTTRLSSRIDGEVDFLKLNIEGSELLVLDDLYSSGKIGLVRELCIEWHSFRDERQRLSEVLRILEECGFRYRIADFAKAGRRRVATECHADLYQLVYGRRMPNLSDSA